MKTKVTRFWRGVGIILLVLILGYSAIRPFHLRWGATEADIARAMPGDLAGSRWTRAIVIDAKPEAIWPWLVQWGQGRGGWYSYDWLENLFGFDIHTATAILPEHQNPQIGDPICMAAKTCTSFVSVIEANRWFGWQAKDEAGKPVWNFVFGLFPVDESHTRLVVRESFDPIAIPSALALLIEIPDVVMEQKALHTVKQRVEGQSVSAFTTFYEIKVWLATFAMGVIAGVLFLKRSDWQAFLAVGVAALLVLQVLTFLFPPLWLRGVLVVGLLVGLVWSLWQRSGVQKQLSALTPENANWPVCSCPVGLGCRFATFLKNKQRKARMGSRVTNQKTHVEAAGMTLLAQCTLNVIVLVGMIGLSIRLGEKLSG